MWDESIQIGLERVLRTTRVHVITQAYTFQIMFYMHSNDVWVIKVLVDDALIPSHTQNT